MSRDGILKEKYSVSYRVIISMIIAFFALAIILGYYYSRMSKTFRDETFIALERDASYVDNKREEIVEQAISSAHKIGYTSALQKVLFSDDASQKVENMAISRELAATERDEDGYILDFFFYADSGHLFTASEYYNDFYKSLGEYGFDKKITLEDSFLSERPIEDKKATFFFLYTPIHRTALGIAHSKRQNGICAILVDFSRLLPNGEGILTDSASCYLFYGDRLLSSYNANPDFKENLLVAFDEGRNQINHGGESYYYYVETNGKWKTVCLTPQNTAVMGAKIFDKNFFLILAVSMLLFAIILFVSNRAFTQSTNRMIEELDRMKNRSDLTRVTVPKMTELELIAKEINRLIGRIEESSESERLANERIVEATIAQKEAEMTAYRSQINPHFFFNTLECVRSMAQYYNVDMIEEIVTAMSKIFRYSLYSELTVPLSDEIDMLEQYFIITDFRFPDKYTLKTEISDETLNYRVPSMILQPLAENCIKHAFSNSPGRKKNAVFVTARIEEDGLLHVTVRDNGCGMSVYNLKKLMEDTKKGRNTSTGKDSIGVRNIYDRVKLFDERNEMRFDSVEGEYMEIALILHESTITKL